jgi:hypothetical protein
MKTAKIIVALFFLVLCAMTESARAQNCPGKIRMTIGMKGHNCSCQKKCVDPSEVAAYQAAYWRVGDCPQFNCGNPGWKNMDEVVNYETSFTDVYPNPASSSTTIFFSLSNAEQVSFKVFDMAGRLVTTLIEQESGEGDNQITWNTSDIKAGIYFLRMESGSYSEMKKVSVIN